MRNKILIIGQGISGTMLSWYLYKDNIPFVVIDEIKHNAASNVAAGIINPVTGRRIVKTWLIDEIMPFAVNAYQTFANEFSIETIVQKNCIDFFATQQMKDAFLDRVVENSDYLQINESSNFSENFKYHLGYGIINPSYIVNLKAIINTWRFFLKTNNLLIEKEFIQNELIVNEENIEWENEKYCKIIFADGANCENNIWFKNLPFAPNKGEALIIETKDLNGNFIYKKGLTIAPLGNNQYWVGANYIWKYEDELPTEKFYNETVIWLNNFLKKEYKIIKHIAAIRPANIERRPFVGFHPKYKNVGIFNGMGAKATSLAPYFANELVQNILIQKTITPEADVNRFAKVLTRN